MSRALALLGIGIAIAALCAAPRSATAQTGGDILLQQCMQAGYDAGNWLPCLSAGRAYATGVGAERDLARALLALDVACANKVAPACDDLASLRAGVPLGRPEHAAASTSWWRLTSTTPCERVRLEFRDNWAPRLQYDRWNQVARTLRQLCDADGCEGGQFAWAATRVFRSTRFAIRDAAGRESTVEAVQVGTGLHDATVTLVDTGGGVCELRRVETEERRVRVEGDPGGSTDTGLTIGAHAGPTWFSLGVVRGAVLQVSAGTERRVADGNLYDNRNRNTRVRASAQYQEPTTITAETLTGVGLALSHHLRARERWHRHSLTHTLWVGNRRDTVVEDGTLLLGATSGYRYELGDGLQATVALGVERRDHQYGERIPTLMFGDGVACLDSINSIVVSARASLTGETSRHWHGMGSNGLSWAGYRLVVGRVLEESYFLESDPDLLGDIAAAAQTAMVLRVNAHPLGLRLPGRVGSASLGWGALFRAGMTLDNRHLRAVGLEGTSWHWMMGPEIRIGPVTVMAAIFATPSTSDGNRTSRWSPDRTHALRGLY